MLGTELNLWYIVVNKIKNLCFTMALQSRGKNNEWRNKNDKQVSICIIYEDNYDRKLT